MTVEVGVSAALARQIAGAFGPEPDAAGSPSEWDFWGGPLAAALVGFRDFEELGFTYAPEVRSLHVVDPVFGPVVFVGVLVKPGVVELDAFRRDPDYWTVIDVEPND